jgi:hypothetical protein
METITSEADTVSLAIEARTTFKFTITWKNKSTNLPINITGYTATAQFRSDYSSSEIYLELSTANGKIVLDPLVGKITITIPPIDTQNLTWNKAVYDLLLRSPDGEVTKVVKGEVEILPTSTVV